MVVLLAARRRRRVGLKERQDDIYACGQLLGTLIRHAVGLALAKRALTVGVIETPLGALLMSSARRSDRDRPRGRAAGIAAVTVASVAMPAEEEDLPAG
jgi:hypothetical protein